MGACIGGLLMGQFFQAPQERQARTDKLILNLQFPDQKTRNMANIAEYKLLKFFNFQTFPLLFHYGILRNKMYV